MQNDNSFDAGVASVTGASLQEPSSDNSFGDGVKQVTGTSLSQSSSDPNSFDAGVQSVTGTSPQGDSTDQATQNALQAGADPQDLANAKAQLGQAAYENYCETFQEKASNSPNMGASATDAWNNYVQQGQARSDVQDMQPGDLVYFSDPNQPDGHTGIYAGSNQFVSATPNGVQQNDMTQWQQKTGQSLLGYVPHR